LKCTGRILQQDFIWEGERNQGMSPPPKKNKKKKKKKKNKKKKKKKNQSFIKCESKRICE